MFGCFYTSGPGLTDVDAASVRLHAKRHNFDGTRSCVWECFSLKCITLIFHAAHPVDVLSDAREALFNVFNRGLERPLIPLWESFLKWKKPLCRAHLAGQRRWGGLVTTKLLLPGKSAFH